MAVSGATVDEVISGYEALLGDGAHGVVVRDVISVTGPDAGRYLQGQLSQDVVAMAADQAWSFLLAPTGRVVAWLRVHRIGADEYLLEVDAGWGMAVRSRLERFLLRTDAVISEPRRTALIQRRWNPTLVRFGDEVPVGSSVAAPVGPGVAGLDVLLVDVTDEAGSEARRDAVPEASLERYRIAHGIPAMGTELTEDTIPGEAGSWVIDTSVSFTKGCYTGQELVARIDSRGNNVPHPIRILSLAEDARVGDIVRFEGVEVGHVTSVTPSLAEGLPALALARVGRSVVEGTSVEVGEGALAEAATVVEPGTVR